MKKSNIKISSHSISFANKEKRTNLCDFIDEYRRIAQLIIDDIWSNGYQWETKKGTYEFNISKNQLHFPSFMKGDIIPKLNINTFLTARSIKCLLTQVVGMISAETEKQRKRMYMLNKLKEKGTSKIKRKRKKKQRGKRKTKKKNV